MIGAFPVFVLGELLTPLAIPEQEQPVPNGYNDLLSAGEIAARTRFDGTLDVELASAVQLQAEVNKCQRVYEIVSRALGKPSAVPIDYKSEDSLLMDNPPAFRAIARALVGKARLAELEGRYDDASSCYRQSVNLGYNIRRGGLLIHALVGMACSGIGANPLYHIRSELSESERRRCIETLVRLDANDETFDEIWHRDRVWSQRAMGWHGHLKQILGDIGRQSFFLDPDTYPYHYWTHQATIRLLICELALASFHRRHDRWPESLSELVPDYVAQVPIDPLDPNGAELRYRRGANDYVLYSVGPNCLDDGGASPIEDDFPGMPETGDLRLDHYFAPDDELGEGSAGDDSNETAETANTGDG